MSAAAVGNFHFIDGIMDHLKYIDILKNNLQESAEKMGLENNFIFMQDNDRKLTALNTKLLVLYNIPEVLQTPPQSPDINPIEHVWDLLDRNIRKHHINSKAVLKSVLVEEWKKLSPEILLILVKSMPRRLDAIIKHKGNANKY